jgi:hypothetical protein
MRAKNQAFVLLIPRPYPHLFIKDMLQDPQWMPETEGNIEVYMLAPETTIVHLMIQMATK